MDKCSICNAEINTEESAILTMGAYGNPRYICDECATDLDTAGLGKDVAEISASMERIGKKMSNADPDGQTYNTVTQLMTRALDRARKIKAGEYDFSLDEDVREGELEEIPEELTETEEDRALDERDAKRGELYDKIYNVIFIIACVSFAVFLVWKIVDTFFLK